MDHTRSLIARNPFGRLGTTAMVAIPTLFLGYFFLYPVIVITARGLTPDGVFSPRILSDVVLDPTLRGVAAFTLWQAILSTVLTLLVGLPAAWVFARYDFPGKPRRSSPLFSRLSLSAPPSSPSSVRGA